ncbi:nitroreductase family protein [Dapis sp. BLCC M229]
MKQPRKGFGKDVIKRLSNFLPEYQNKYGSDEIVMITLNALQEYYDFNLELGLENEINETAYQTISKIKNNFPQDNYLLGKEGGTKTVKKSNIQASAEIDLRGFFTSRYSIRQFTDEEVDISLIEQAAIIAQKTPSVCNRQFCRLYAFSEEEQKQKVLSCQNGNRGFGNQASTVLIVTSNLEHFASIGERYQGWIDGGMFSMSLVYGLHSLGLGTCCLNWSVKNKQDKELKMIAGIPDSDLVIMMIAVGHLPEEFKVAQSPRKPLKEVLIIGNN